MANVSPESGFVPSELCQIAMNDSQQPPSDPDPQRRPVGGGALFSLVRDELCQLAAAKLPNEKAGLDAAGNDAGHEAY